MEARKTGLVKFLNGSKQFSIPIYQRTYSWTEKECEQLWDDIVRVAKNEKIPTHFIGSIVYIENSVFQASDVAELLVIDGQQRLTTISLLLAALGRSLENNSEISKTKIDNLYLLNSEESGEKRYKLLLRKKDRETFKSIIEGEIPEEASPNIANNFEFFSKQIEKNDIGLDLLYQGIGKLVVVDISLDSNYDNPQLIFESLNSTGVDLSQSDLIRNYVLMGLDTQKQEQIYTKFWHPIEKIFDSYDSKYFDRFMRDYLTMKTGQIPNIREVYSSFKEYFASSDDTVDDIIPDIHHFSKLFARLAFGREPNPRLNEIIHDINTLEVNVAYPFFLEVLDDHHKKMISDDELLQIFQTAESYIVRRVICEIPTNSLNKTFAGLAGEIDKEDAYLESIKAAFSLKSSYRRFPDDNEFHTSFRTKNVYHLKIRRYLLDKLENHGRKERVNVDDYTIEHIMPQNENLSEEWKNELGPNWRNVRDTYLHTIGNLTLTGYNPELSDRPFLEKRDMRGGFATSPISLNADLKCMGHWNEGEICKRANSIISRAEDIWKFPKLPDDVLSKYKKIEVDEDYEEDEDPMPKWDKNVESASEATRQDVNEMISKIKEKFDCEIEPKSWWLYCYVRKPMDRKSCFAVLDCHKNTATVCFRVNPDTFQGDDLVRSVAGWFFPRGTERRMAIKKELIHQACQHLEHSYDTTNHLLQKMHKTA